MTYAVRWRDNNGPEFAGGLVVSGAGVELTGTAAGCPAGHLDVAYDHVRELYLERPAAQPSLVLVTDDGHHVTIGSLQGLGALHELADHVAAARGKAAV